MRLNWCCYLAGKEFNADKKLGSQLNAIQIESDYHWQAHQLLAGFKILSEMVGDQKARKMTGKLQLTAWMGAASGPERDREIRSRLQKELLGEHNRSFVRASRRTRRE